MHCYKRDSNTGEAIICTWEASWAPQWGHTIGGALRGSPPPNRPPASSMWDLMWLRKASKSGNAALHWLHSRLPGWSYWLWFWKQYFDIKALLNLIISKFLCDNKLNADFGKRLYENSLFDILKQEGQGIFLNLLFWQIFLLFVKRQKNS